MEYKLHRKLFYGYAAAIQKCPAKGQLDEVWWKMELVQSRIGTRPATRWYRPIGRYKRWRPILSRTLTLTLALWPAHLSTWSADVSSVVVCFIFATVSTPSTVVWKSSIMEQTDPDFGYLFQLNFLSRYSRREFARFLTVCYQLWAARSKHYRPDSRNESQSTMERWRSNCCVSAHKRQQNSQLTTCESQITSLSWTVINCASTR